MNDSHPFERQIAILIATYADRAPTNVEPTAMMRLAVDERRRARTGFLSMPSVPRLGFAVLVVVLASAIVGAALTAGGGLFQRGLTEPFTEQALVKPFADLPPVGARPSSPEVGELILSVDGRLASTKLRFHRAWVYADGRLIWIREGTTTGVLEQRLTPEGVELLRSEVISSSSRVLEAAEVPPGGEIWHRPGMLWGGIQVRVGDELLHIDWADASLPRRLADPASWLPPSAWADQRSGAFVPSRYAVCFEHFSAGAVTVERSRLMDLLPKPAQNLIRSGALEIRPHAAADRDARCLYQVTTDDARAVAAMLADAGLPRDLDSTRYYIDIGRLGVEGEAMVELLPVLPHGGLVCNCG